MNNPYLLIPIIAWVVGQSLKVLYKSIRSKDASWRDFLASGGMPSTHAAIVTALAVTAVIEDGFGSPGFGISVVLLLVVIVDAVNVRRAVGENRQAIKTLYRLVPLAKRRTKDDDVLERSEALGHSPTEVVAGAYLGFAVAYGLLYSVVTTTNGGLQARPVGVERTLYLIIFVLMIVLAVLLSVVTSRGGLRRLPTARRLRASFRHALLYPGLVGLIMLWGQEQSIERLGRRWLVWAVLSVALAAGLYYASNLYTNLNERFSDDIQQKRASKKKRKQRRRKR